MVLCAESLAAGVIFTFPALFMINKGDEGDEKVWDSVNYPVIIILAISGGVDLCV
jgi:uncharacterized oligopeptide transporter (OPT) family protein